MSTLVRRLAGDFSILTRSRSSEESLDKVISDVIIHCFAIGHASIVNQEPRKKIGGKMKSKYVLPRLTLNAFNCPNCHVYTKQRWSYMSSTSRADGFGSQYRDERFKISACEHCGFPTIWYGGQIIWPLSSSAPPASPDLPEELVQDYEEASSIVNLSPRGAAALLRLVIQKLCAHLGQSGKNINADIKALVAEGLPAKVQEALDSVRVIGNDAVHPGEIDLRDDPETASKLFHLVNFIVQKTITEPREIDEIYNGLPASKLDGIKNRDAS